MGLFKNEGLDYMDYTLLQKKGLIKKSEPKNDVIDFTAPSSSNLPSPPTESSDNSTNDFGSFFESVEASPPPASSASYESPFAALDNPPAQVPSANADTHINALKIKLEDLEYKLERMLDRLSQIESKITN